MDRTPTWRIPARPGGLAGRAALFGWLAAGLVVLVVLGCSVGYRGAARGFLGGGVFGPSSARGIPARCTVTWTDSSRAADVGRVLAADPNATICFRVLSGGQSGGGYGEGVGGYGESVGGSAEGAVSGAGSKILTGSPRRIMLHTTGYSFQDNQGGDNATISCGILHKTAGGAGTYQDPTTVAVPGHAGQGTETPCGTRFYVPKYRKYFIVEDTGATKYDDAHHIDIYVGGQDGSKDASYKCQEAVTTEDGSPTPAIVNPPPGEPVQPGPIAQGGGCHLS